MALKALNDIGLEVLVVWECEIKDAEVISLRLGEFMRSNPAAAGTVG